MEPGIGYKFQLALTSCQNEQEKLKNGCMTCSTILWKWRRLHESLYDTVGPKRLKTFLRYNANSWALMNLGHGSPSQTQRTMSILSLWTVSQPVLPTMTSSPAGNGYLLGEVEAMQDDDYNCWFIRQRTLFKIRKEGFFVCLLIYWLS